jgi:hypothetical protein
MKLIFQAIQIKHQRQSIYLNLNLNSLLKEEFLVLKMYYQLYYIILVFHFKKSHQDGVYKKHNNKGPLNKFNNKKKHHLKNLRKKKKMNNKGPKHRLLKIYLLNKLYQL